MPFAGGRVLDLGWLVLDDLADPVAGYVFVSAKLAEHWNELDAFEGEEYERVRALAHLGSEDTVEVFIYVLRE